jgi:hypothetical protein
MERYDPATALDELNEDAMLPHPVRVRDMILRAHLAPENALEVNRKFQGYLKAFGETQSIAREILSDLVK